jgi:hypothetical protein
MVVVSWATRHCEAPSTMAEKLSALGVDIDKLVCHIVGINNRHEMALHPEACCPYGVAALYRDPPLSPYWHEGVSRGALLGHGISLSMAMTCGS